MLKKILIIIFTTTFSIAYGQEQKTPISPCSFGMEEAKTDIERFYALYNTHVAAIEQGVDVDYDGIDRLNIEIPADAKPIPLTSYNIFHSLVLNVRNNSKNFYLFRLSQPTDSIDVSKEQIDGGDFGTVKELRTGKFLIVLQDNRLWVDQRQGYKYGHTRKDILLIEDGKAANQPIMPYNTPETQPAVSYCPVTDDFKVISDIVINRTPDSKFKTYCFDVKNQYNVELCDIIINTPKSELVADNAIRITNCADVTLEYVKINETYSRKDYYGYGILMDNVWDSKIRNLTSHSDWGIFGTNNISEALLENCNINRYDIHCYGRNATIRNCTFDNLYNQFSSMYGQLKFERCIFNKHIPVLIESTYNAYTPFDIEFDRCVFNINGRCNYLVDARTLSDIRNSRPEVADKNLPNITLNNCIVNLFENTNRLYMFHFTHVHYTDTVGYLEQIYIDNLKVHGGKVVLKVGNKDFKHNKLTFPMYNQEVGDKK